MALALLPIQNPKLENQAGNQRRWGTKDVGFFWAKTLKPIETQLGFGLVSNIGADLRPLLLISGPFFFFNCFREILFGWS